MKREMKKTVICGDIKGDKHEVAVSELYYRPSVYGIIIKDDKILLFKQWDGYDFPGGGAEIDETLTEAVERECWEETGFTVKQGETIHCETSFFVMPFGEGHVNSVLAYFLCNITGGKLSKENFDEYEKDYAELAEWIDLSEIENIKFINSVDSVAIIKKAIKMLKA